MGFNLIPQGSFSLLPLLVKTLSVRCKRHLKRKPNIVIYFIVQLQYTCIEALELSPVPHETIVSTEAPLLMLQVPFAFGLVDSVSKLWWSALLSLTPFSEVVFFIVPI